ncbi:radical SAM protein [Oscillospiraceae bacterium MB08-C2-2]|nr:radical SAM protein [Oscillospiraceae bacterium MB08-C2-2]
MKHRNIPVFVPHLGCPHQCSFCDQRRISGTAEPPSPQKVTALLEQSCRQLGSEAQNAQIAFFGGSFTAIDRQYMISLLEAAAPFLGEGGFSGIRVSTRPDAICRDMVALLGSYGVTTVELGAQSMNDRVLAESGRGHTAEQTRKAAALIREQGISLGLQMMTGLPGDTDDTAMETARELAALEPSQLRIYPALVLEGTHLADLYRQGRYQPQTLEQAVSLGAKLLCFFTERDITVIRMGLQAAELLESSLVAGPYHPAFRELCEGEIFLNRALEAADIQGLSGRILLTVEPGSPSKMAGQHRKNTKELEKRGLFPRIDTDPALGYLQVRVMAREV